MGKEDGEAQRGIPVPTKLYLGKIIISMKKENIENGHSEKEGRKEEREEIKKEGRLEGRKEERNEQ